MVIEALAADTRFDESLDNPFLRFVVLETRSLRGLTTNTFLNYGS